MGRVGARRPPQCVGRRRLARGGERGPPVRAASAGRPGACAAQSGSGESWMHAFAARSLGRARELRPPLGRGAPGAAPAADRLLQAVPNLVSPFDDIRYTSQHLPCRRLPCRLFEPLADLLTELLEALARGKGRRAW